MGAYKPETYESMMAEAEAEQLAAITAKPKAKTSAPARTMESEALSWEEEQGANQRATTYANRREESSNISKVDTNTQSYVTAHDDSDVSGWAGRSNSFMTRIYSDMDFRANTYQSVGGLSKYHSDANDAIAVLIAQGRRHRSYLEKNRGLYGDSTVNSTISAIDEIIKNLEKTYVSIASENDYWSSFSSEEDYNSYKKFQDYEKLCDETGFDFYSQYKSTENGKGFKRGFDFFAPASGNQSNIDNPYGGVRGPAYTETGYHDIIYDYINGNQEAITILETNEGADGSKLFGISSDYLKHIKPQEVEIFNYIYATQGKEKAYEYINLLGLYSRQRRDKEEKARMYAARHPRLSSVETVFGAPLSAVRVLPMAVDYADDGELTKDAQYMDLSYMKTAVRDEVSKNFGKVDGFLYNTAMSWADSVATGLMTGGIGTLPFLFGRSAVDAAVSALDRGLDSDQAFAFGITSGAIEAITEKIGLDKLLNTSSLQKGVAQHILRNMAAEGLSEGLAGIGNTIADIMIAKDKSEWQRAIQAYVNDGLSENKAFSKVFRETALSVGADTLAGMLMGGTGATLASARTVANAYSTGHDAVSNPRGEDMARYLAHEQFNDVADPVERARLIEQEARRYREEHRRDVARSLIDSTREDGNPLSDSYKYADKLQVKMDAGKRPSNYAIGNLINKTAFDNASVAIANETIGEAVAAQMDGKLNGKLIYNVAKNPDAMRELAHLGYIDEKTNPIKRPAAVRAAIEKIAKDAQGVEKPAPIMLPIRGKTDTSSVSSADTFPSRGRLWRDELLGQSSPAVDTDGFGGYTESQGVIYDEGADATIPGGIQKEAFGNSAGEGAEADTIADSSGGEHIYGESGEPSGDRGGLFAVFQNRLGEKMDTRGGETYSAVERRTYSEVGGARDENHAGRRYRYKAVGREGASDKALSIADEWTARGFSVVIYEGKVEAVRENGSSFDTADACTLKDGSILLNNNPGLSEVNILAHEPIHVYSRAYKEIFKPIYRAIYDSGIDSRSETLDLILGNYDKDGSHSDINNIPRLYEEILAQLSGYHALDPAFAREKFAPLIYEYDKVIAAIENAHSEFAKLQQNKKASDENKYTTDAFSMREEDLDVREDDIRESSKRDNGTELDSPYDTEKAGKEFINSVDKDMLDFIDKVASDSSDNKSVYIIGQTTKKLNQKIQNLTGIDTTQFKNSVKANSIRHIIKDHGVNGLTDNSMSNNEDIARMGYVIENFDDIELLDTASKEYRDRNQKPAKMIKLSKKVDGTYYVVEAVPDTNAKSLAVVSAYIKKASTQQTEDVQAPSSNVQNASADVEVYNNIVPQDTDIVKDSMSKNEGEDTTPHPSATLTPSPQGEGFEDDTKTSQQGKGVGADSVSDAEIARAMMEELGIESEGDLQDWAYRNGIINREALEAQGDIRRALRKYYRKVVNAQSPFERASKAQRKHNPKGLDLESSVQQVRGAGGIVDAILEDGLYDIDGNKIGESWSEVAALFPKGKEAEFDAFLKHRHNIARYKEGKPVLKATDEQSQKYVDEALARNPEFSEIADKVYSWWKTFMDEYGVKSGLVNKEQLAEIREKYPYYVPTFRTKFDGVASSMSRGRKISTAKVIQNATGDITNIKDVRDGIADYVNKVVRSERKNELFLNLLQFARENPASASEYVLIADPAMKTENLSALDNVLDPDGANKNSIRELRDGIYEITAFEDGKSVSMYVTREVFEALDTLINPRISDAQKIGRMVTGVPKALITGKNIFFAMTNTIRDLQSGYANSIVNNPVKFISSVARAAYEIARGSESFKQYKALGGARSGFFSREDGFIKSNEKKFSEKKNIKNLLRKVNDTVFALNNISEQMVRYAEYKNYLAKHGDSPANRRRAALAAADITVNFSRSAPLTKSADAWVMYLNAGVQGLDKMARQVKSRPISTLLKSGLGGILTSEVLGRLVPLLLGIAGNDDNPYYEELTNYTKDNYYIIPNAFDTDEDGNARTFIKIPKSREYGVLLVALWERISRVIQGEDSEDVFKDWAQNVFGNIAPANPFTNNIYSPFLDIMRNKTFSGATIVPESMKNLDKVDPELQYDATTSEISKWIGRRFKVSPMKVEHVIDSYSGIVGDILLPATTGKWDNPARFTSEIFLGPIKNKFTANPIYSSQSVSDFYDNYDKAQGLANSKNIRENIPKDYRTPEEVRASHYEAAAKEISELRKREKQLLDTMPNTKEREALMDEIRREIVVIAKAADAAAEQVYAEYKKNYIPEISMHSDKRQGAMKTMEEKYGTKYEDFAATADAIALPIVDGKVSSEEGYKQFYKALPIATKKIVDQSKTEESTAFLRRHALYSIGGYSPEEKAYLDAVLIAGKKEDEIDEYVKNHTYKYESEGALFVSQLDETHKEKCAKAKSVFGISDMDYFKAVDAMKELESKNKKDMTAKLMDLGYDEETADAFYSIVWGSKKK